MAVLDLDGRLVALKSQKHWPQAELSAFLASFAPIAVIASDRNPPAHAAAKLAASFAARLFKPKHSLSVHEKNQVVRSVDAVRNAHERDAYAAAKKAFDVLWSNKVRQLDRRFGPRATAAVKAAVLSGMRADWALASG